ncbi:terminase small subunit [Anabaena phage Elbi]|nr:terminase small subunit [Anabaena phage Elbi]
MIDTNTIDVIKEVLEKSGDINAACIAANITRHTFEKWLQLYPTFKDIVKDSKEFYKNCLVSDWDIDAIAYTNNLLKGRVVSRSVVKRFVLPRQELADDEEFTPESGELVEIYREEREQTVQPPKWLLERYLPKENVEPIKVQINFADMPDMDGDDPEATEVE